VRTLTSLRPPMILEVTHQVDEVTRLLHDYGYVLKDQNGASIDRARFMTLAVPR
jgi:hypothetical protein